MRLSSFPTQTPVVICGVNPMYHASVKSFVVPVFPADGRPKLLRAHAGAELHHVLKHRDHGARHVGRQHVGDRRTRLFKNRAVVGRHAANVVRLDMNAIVRKHSEGGSVLHQRQVGSAKRQRQIRRQRALDAGLPRQRRSRSECPPGSASAPPEYFWNRRARGDT